jgi:hypothetical protein
MAGDGAKISSHKDDLIWAYQEARAKIRIQIVQAETSRVKLLLTSPKAFIMQYFTGNGWHQRSEKPLTGRAQAQAAKRPANWRQCAVKRTRSRSTARPVIPAGLTAALRRNGFCEFGDHILQGNISIVR